MSCDLKTDLRVYIPITSNVSETWKFKYKNLDVLAFLQVLSHCTILSHFIFISPAKALFVHLALHFFAVLQPSKHY